MDQPAVGKMIWETLPGWCGPAVGATPDQFNADGIHHDVALLRGAARELPVGNPIMVELGSFAGRSAFVLHEARPDLALHCFDPYREGCVEDGMLGVSIHEARRIFETAIEKCCADHADRHPGITLHPIDSIQGGAAYDGPPVHLLHVDGLHTYDQVRAELLAWVVHLTPSAQVIFDDWLSYEGQIQRAAWEVLRPSDGWHCRDEGIGSRGRGYGRFRLERIL